jgi:hypothetical protein
MIASRDYRLTNEIMNLYKQIIWEAFTLLHWYILPTTIYKNVFVLSLEMIGQFVSVLISG